MNLSLILPTSFSLPDLNSVPYVAVLEEVSLQISCSGHEATIITSNHMTHSNCWQLVFHNTAVHQSVHLYNVQATFLLSSYWNVWGRTTGIPTLHHQCIQNQTYNGDCWIAVLNNENQKVQDLGYSCSKHHVNTWHSILWQYAWNTGTCSQFKEFQKLLFVCSLCKGV